MPNSLAHYLLEVRNSPERLSQLFWIVERQIALRSTNLDRPNFDRLSKSDLKLIFEEIDRSVLDSQLNQLLTAGGHGLSFRISRRMTSTGGTTVTRRAANGSLSLHEITVSASLLHQTYVQANSAIVCGIPCDSMRAALLRIMEHEIIHLAEMVVWNNSCCSGKRFKSIASRLFGHRQSNHNLITNLQLAEMQHGLRPGDSVTFQFEGERLKGFINRIHRRATVLVPSPNGLRYSNGERYVKYYVPLERLSPNWLDTATKKPRS